MNKRVVRVALVAAVVALVLLAVPLAVAIRVSFFADERGEVERRAMAAAARVSPDFASGDPVELPPGPSEGQVGVYDRQLRLRAGTGPGTADSATRRAMADKVVQEQTDDDLVAAVPVSQNERVIGVVRASTATQGVWNRVLLGWGALVAAVLIALGVAVLVARRQARILSAPLEALSRTSLAIADGDLSARAELCGITEIDQVAATHNTMVQHLAQLLQRERHFTANASHQLRTPLTGLQLGLETGLNTPGADQRAALEEALEQAHHLQHTIDEVLRLATAEALPAAVASTRPAGDLLDQVEARWHGPFAQDSRRMEVVPDPAALTLPVPGRTTDQILDILLDNARRHGTGTVTVTLRELGGALALDVADEGTLAIDAKRLFERGVTTGPGRGIGLSLALDLAESAGARLSLSQRSPTRFTLLLPLAE
ncbi:HAMP domain-containing sensor histidine kinase [Streptomyces longhuiensis]|uniref:sensor histidine kinase n=1 Tax=Streptomyces TaxID=1883 RepID=UPI001D0B3D9F|nr:HAMP domain-containing sensor histidine kinase [Streptomyces longhuiensis]UDL97135.1 HAMP domain-containing histidine kinase [Streptomyces longhuiensis]